MLRHVLGRGFVLGIAISSVISVLLLLAIPSLVPREAYTWSTLYLGGAIVSLFATLVTIPFAIWVLYMQSRFGAIVVRLFISRIVTPFTVLILIVATTAIAMVLSFSYLYVYAYMLLIAESAIFIPLLALYVLKLMTLTPIEVVNTIISSPQRLDEKVTALLKLATTYISESPIEEKAVSTILRQITLLLVRSDVERNPPTPPTWHMLRSFLATIVKEHVPLPSRRVLGALLRVFLMWLLLHGKDRASKVLMRYYRRVALRYLEVRLPSEVVRDLIVVPLIDPLTKVRTKSDVRTYAYTQIAMFLRSLRTMVLRGEIVADEMCRCIAVIERAIPRDEDPNSIATLRDLVTKLKREYRCARRYVRRKSVKAEKLEKTAIDMVHAVAGRTTSNSITVDGTEDANHSGEDDGEGCVPKTTHNGEGEVCRSHTERY